MGNFSTSYYATAVAGAATVTLAAKAGSPAKAWTIQGFLFSYSATPDAGATLTVQKGSDVVLRVAVTSAGPGPIIIPPTSGDGNEALSVSLSSGGTGITGYLTVFVV